ncbi:hypothetical protein [Treponema sp. OMZ 855]|uniref:hypothetical protein n=1 Tax=Treponema sp. OMZ 855 TaxID=1643512 RepID=UPI0020A4A287|nr:hypothetical protein [Treponema sp. OMZ 855]UTC50341.1 hypothetical protein E4N65_09675 [Treponema sp. OMZ 855]
MIVEKDGFKFFQGDVDQTDCILINDDNITSVSNYILAHKIRGIMLMGRYSRDDINFIEEFPWLETIIIQTTNYLKDITVLNRLPHLQSLWGDFCLNCKLENSSIKYIGGDWSKNGFISDKCINLQYISITKCKDFPLFFTQLINLPNLNHLSIIKGTLVKDCTFIKPMRKLEYLDLSYLIKLESLNGIEVLAPTLRYLDLDTGSKIYDHSHLKTLKKLEVLRITHKGIIKSLDFIQEMPMLKELVVVGPKLEDNNLSYCNHIPTLRIWR